MLARIRKAQEEEGFTLIELLVVMIIIGILAAIAIPVFLSQREKAQDSAAKADVSTIGKELATYFVDNTAVPTIDDATGRYVLTSGAVPDNPATTGVDESSPGETQDLGKVSSNVALVTVDITDADTWCVDVINTKGDKQEYAYSSTDGLIQGTC